MTDGKKNRSTLPPYYDPDYHERIINETRRNGSEYRLEVLISLFIVVLTVMTWCVFSPSVCQ